MTRQVEVDSIYFPKRQVGWVEERIAVPSIRELDSDHSVMPGYPPDFLYDGILVRHMFEHVTEPGALAFAHAPDETARFAERESVAPIQVPQQPNVIGGRLPEGESPSANKEGAS